MRLIQGRLLMITVGIPQNPPAIPEQPPFHGRTQLPGHIRLWHTSTAESGVGLCWHLVTPPLEQSRVHRIFAASGDWLGRAESRVGASSTGSNGPRSFFLSRSLNSCWRSEGMPSRETRQRSSSVNVSIASNSAQYCCGTLSNDGKLFSTIFTKARDIGWFKPLAACSILLKSSSATRGQLNEKS